MTIFTIDLEQAIRMMEDGVKQKKWAIAKCREAGQILADTSTLYFIGEGVFTALGIDEQIQLEAKELQFKALKAASSGDYITYLEKVLEVQQKVYDALTSGACLK